METGFEYYAFISYKREDEKWAKWLQNKLETYKLPTSLAKETGKELPKTFHPCFRDKTDLSETGDLSQILHDKLQKSQYLIVVCSPRAAKSKWVNKEVETFQKMGRTDKIIPFIIEGNPDTSNPNVHCYPLTLDENILGISIPELGKEKAVVKTIAAMLNVNFDTLWNRHRERILKRRIQIAIGSAIFIAVFGGFSTWQSLKIFEQNRQIQIQSESLKETNQQLIKKSNELQITNNILNDKNTELKEKNTLIENQNKEIKKQSDRIQKEYEKSEQLNKSIYFYDDKVALSSKFDGDKNVFCYINKEGKELTYLGRWKYAEPFDKYTGLAKITKNDSVYFLDISGKIHSEQNTTIMELPKEFLQRVVDIAQLVAKAEYLNMVKDSIYTLEYEELVSIGIIAAQVLIKNKKPEQLQKFSPTYIATAMRWAIRNELRIRYAWYANKYKAIDAYSQDEVVAGIDIQQYQVRVNIYETVLSVDNLTTANDNLFNFGKEEQKLPHNAELSKIGRLIRESISKLSGKERQIVEYRLYKNMEVKTIAEKTGVQPAEITGIINEALNKLKEYLNVHGEYGY